jgi:hypothetical protein
MKPWYLDEATNRQMKVLRFFLMYVALIVSAGAKPHA